MLQHRKGKVKMDIYGAKLMELEKYLKSNNLVPENKIKYFSNWADKFLHGINYKVSAIDQNSIISFINTMSKDQRYEDWQIRQAAGFKIKIFSHKGAEAQR